MRYTLYNRAQDVLGNIDLDGGLIKLAEALDPTLLDFINAHAGGDCIPGVLHDSAMIIWGRDDTLFQLLAEGGHWIELSPIGVSKKACAAGGTR